MKVSAIIKLVEDNKYCVMQDIELMSTVIANAGIGKHWGLVADTPIQEVEDHLKANSVGSFLVSGCAILLLASTKPRFAVHSTTLESMDCRRCTNSRCCLRNIKSGDRLFRGKAAPCNSPN
jgi:NAD(P)-dependent dehydrogenase (short-subunit alcohol dehydrogenase family)